jgi:ankyrin repeat protein
MVSKRERPKGPRFAARLLDAVLRSDMDEVAAAVAAGADPNAIHRKLLPLEAALAFLDLPMLKHLVKLGANPDARRKDGETLVSVAADLHERAGLRALLALGASPINALHAAAEIGEISTIKALLERGVDVDAVDELGNTALYYAARSENSQSIRFLLKRSANPRRSRGSVLIAFLDQFWNPRCSLLDGFPEDRSPVVRRLLDAGALVNELGASGGRLAKSTPLMAAARAGPRAVRLLLEHGADPNLPNDFGETALMHAARAASGVDSVELLLAKGADARLKDREKRTAADYALAAGATGLALHLKDVAARGLRVVRPARRAGINERNRARARPGV